MKIKLSEDQKTPCLTFECQASIVDKDSFDNGLSLFAGVSDISKNFKPDVSKSDAMWYLAGNLAVPGLANKNKHGILIEDAIRIKDKFVGQQINKDHNRANVVGYISKAIFTDRESGEELDDVAAASCKKPVNLTIGFVVWPHVDEGLATTIEAVTNPLVVDQGYISLSWEMSFDEYFLVKGSSNAYEGEIIREDEEIAKYEEFMPWNKGQCMTDKGELLYVFATGEYLTPLGAGLVVNPAAQVKGIVMIATEEEKDAKIKELELKVLELTEKLDAPNSLEVAAEVLEPEIFIDESSQSVVSSVIVLQQSIMKIKSIDQITDENLGVEIKASAISEFFAEELAKKSEEFSAEVKAKEDEAANAKSALAAIETELASIKLQNEESSAKLKEIEDARAAEQILASFNERMNVLDGEFELCDEDREIIAGQIRGLSDEDYTNWNKSFSILAKEKNKEVIASKAPKVEIKASVEETVVDDKPLEDLKTKETVIASTIQFGDDSIEKFRDAFTLDKGVKLAL
jgi:hypothetical protein